PPHMLAARLQPFVEEVAEALWVDPVARTVREAFVPVDNGPCHRRGLALREECAPYVGTLDGCVLENEQPRPGRGEVAEEERRSFGRDYALRVGDQVHLLDEGQLIRIDDRKALLVGDGLDLEG